MTTQSDKATWWQFRLISLFVATFVVAVSCVLWAADPAWWAIVTSWALSMVLPAGSVSGAIFFRGYRRAFFIGMAATQVAYSFDAAYQAENVLRMLSEEDVTQGFAMSIDTSGLARTTIVVFGLSLVSGLLATAVRWFAIRTDAAQHG